MVQKGKFSACALLEFVKALNKVDFPTFGKPTIPQRKAHLFIIYSTGEIDSNFLSIKIVKELIMLFVIVSNSLLFFCVKIF